MASNRLMARPQPGRGIGECWGIAVLIPILAIGLTACASEPPQPTLAIGRVAVSPSLEASAAQRMAAYAAERGVPAFDLEPWLEQAAIEALDAGELDLLISGREPPQGWFATPLWTEGIAVVVHPSNPVRSYTLAELGALYRGLVGSWDILRGDSIPVTLIAPYPDDSLRLRFEALAMNGATLSAAARLALTPQDTIIALRQDPGGIGLIPFSQLSADVRAARVEGVLPSEGTVADGRYPLRLQIAAIAPSEPTGALRDWLAWIQADEAP